MNINLLQQKLDSLYRLWKDGKLGGEYMPEDSNPQLKKESLQNYNYFTLPMALNYQRNSYKLWEGAKLTFEDEETQFVFDTNKALAESAEKVRASLVKYKVALQPNKQTQTWLKLCQTIKTLFDGDIRNLFVQCDFDIEKIKDFIQVKHKKEFPYLSGQKICNYWLYVLSQYTDANFKNLEKLTVAVDTHVVQSCLKLGVINDMEAAQNNVQELVSARVNEILKGTKYNAIDLHTPLWLWSRNGFINLN